MADRCCYKLSNGRFCNQKVIDNSHYPLAVLHDEKDTFHSFLDISEASAAYAMKKSNINSVSHYITVKLAFEAGLNLGAFYTFAMLEEVVKEDKSKQKKETIF